MRVLFFGGPNAMGEAANSFVEMVKTLHDNHNIECVVCSNNDFTKAEKVFYHTMFC
jgi:hypothetical protein